MKEAILEPILRKLRIRRVLPVIKQYPECKLLDVGCGWEARLLKQVEPHVALGIGIDFKAPPHEFSKIKTISATIDKTLPFADSSFHVVTLMATLEHLQHPEAILHDIHRILLNGGIVVGTVPSKASKPVLEFLSYKLNIVNPDEIRDHKQYFDKKSLVKILKECGFKDIQHSYFQLGMNNFFIGVKK